MREATTCESKSTEIYTSHTTNEGVDTEIGTEVPRGRTDVLTVEIDLQSIRRVYITGSDLRPRCRSRLQETGSSVVVTGGLTRSRGSE